MRTTAMMVPNLVQLWIERTILGHTCTILGHTCTHFCSVYYMCVTVNLPPAKLNLAQLTYVTHSVTGTLSPGPGRGGIAACSELPSSRYGHNELRAPPSLAMCRAKVNHLHLSVGIFRSVRSAVFVKNVVDVNSIIAASPN